MEKKEDYLKKAVFLAADNVRENGGGPFGALIVRNGEVLGSGVNSVTIENDPTAHAEINAIRNACRKLGTFNLKGCTLYTSCEPCPMCLSAAYWARIDGIIFAADKITARDAGFDDAFIYEEITRTFSDRTIKTEQIAVKESNMPFEIWKESDNKIPY
jgi:guanine deaminase